MSSNFKLVSSVNGLNNYFCKDVSQFEAINTQLKNDSLQEYINSFEILVNELMNKEISLRDLENSLVKKYTAGKEIFINNKIRFANCFGWEDTALIRSETKIQPTKNNNIGESIVDPIGFSSRVAAPNKEYGFLGKIPELRPSSESFNEELYEELFSRSISISNILGFAIELGTDTKSQEEIAVMPLVRLTGAENIIRSFSQVIDDSYSQTAKYYGINKI